MNTFVNKSLATGEIEGGNVKSSSTVLLYISLIFSE